MHFTRTKRDRRASNRREGSARLHHRPRTDRRGADPAALGTARADRAGAGRVFHLLVRPARWVWRTFLRPVLRAVARAWRVTVLTPVRWLHVNVLKPAGAAVRSAFWAVGLDTRRP